LRKFPLSLQPAIFKKDHLPGFLCLPFHLLLLVNTAALCGCKNAQAALFSVFSHKKYKIILWQVCFSFTVVRKYLPAQLFYC
jgi:hypothetical protein